MSDAITLEITGNPIIPEELRNLLLDFTMNYVHEDAGDIIDFGLNYFTKLKDKAKEKNYVQASKEEELPGPCRSQLRRKAVFSETNLPIDCKKENRVTHTKTEAEKEKIKEVIKNVFVFSTAEEETLDEVIDHFQKEVYCPGNIVMEEGDDSHTFYIVEQGSFEGYITVGNENREAAIYDGSGVFGETALLHNLPRDMTVKATTNGVLWALDRGTFRMIFLNAAIKKREDNLELVTKVPLFKSLTSDERLSLADALIYQEYNEGDKIVGQGGRPEGMYFVLKGTVEMRVTNDENLREVTVRSLGEGNYFGEMSLISHRPVGQSAYAVDKVRVAFLGVDAFERLVGSCIEVMKRNIQDFEEQMKVIFGDLSNIVDIRGTLSLLPPE